MPRFLRRGLGWLLTAVALPLVPACWIGVLHAPACTTLLEFLLHQALISWSPPLALALFAAGDALLQHR